MAELRLSGGAGESEAAVTSAAAVAGWREGLAYPPPRRRHPHPRVGGSSPAAPWRIPFSAQPLPEVRLREMLESTLATDGACRTSPTESVPPRETLLGSSHCRTQSNFRRFHTLKPILVCGRGPRLARGRGPAGRGEEDSASAWRGMHAKSNVEPAYHGPHSPGLPSPPSRECSKEASVRYLSAPPGPGPGPLPPAPGPARLDTISRILGPSELELESRAVPVSDVGEVAAQDACHHGPRVFI